MEQQIGLVAKGQADKDSVVVHALDQFRQKFLFFVTNIQRMDALFEASFSPLASSGGSCCDAAAVASRVHIPPHWARFQPCWTSQVTAAVAVMLRPFGAIHVMLCQVSICHLPSSRQSCWGVGEVA